MSRIRPVSLGEPAMPDYLMPYSLPYFALAFTVLLVGHLCACLLRRRNARRETTKGAAEDDT